MKRIAICPIAFIFVIAIAIPSYLSAAIFCNMDNAGGSGGKKVQAQSALAAASFMRAASIAFQMFEQIELHLAGEKEALNRAAVFGKNTMEFLSSASAGLKRVLGERDALKVIDYELSQQRDYSVAFRRARVPTESPIGRLVDKARKDGGSVGLVGVCMQSINDLQSPELAMGSVYKSVSSGESPGADQLWGAIAQWNEALIKGRLVSSMFALK